MAKIDSYTKLLLHCNGIDGNRNKPITAVGNAQVDTAQSKFGGASLLLDGTGDYLTVPDSADWDFGTGNFTIDFWVRFAVLPLEGANHDFFAQCTTNNDNSMRLYLNEGVNLYFVVFAGASPVIIVNGAWTPNTNTWYHIALVRHENDFNIYVDGVSKASGTDSDACGNYSGLFHIGATFNGSGNYINGWMDEFRVSKGIARWTSNFSVPTSAYEPDSYTKLLIHAGGVDASTNFEDSSGFSDFSPSGHKIAFLDNAQVKTDEFKFGGASLNTPDLGSYLTVPDSADWDFGTGNFTIDFWLRRTGGHDWGGLVGSTDNNTGWTVQFGSSGVGSKKTVILRSTGSGSYQVDLIANEEVTDSVWMHIAVVRNGNTITIYYDGVSKGSCDCTGYTIDNTASEVLRVGWFFSGGYGVSGWFDEIRVSKGIARWTANFNPPTRQYGMSAGGSFLFNMI